MDFLGGLIVLAGAGAVLVGGISIVVPLRFLGVTSRVFAIGILIAGLFGTTLGTKMSPKLQADAARAQAMRQKQEEADARQAKREATNKPPVYSSSGGCKTNAFGDMTCEHSASLNAGWLKSSSESTMKCRTNPLTKQYECNSEMTAR